MEILNTSGCTCSARRAGRALVPRALRLLFVATCAILLLWSYPPLASCKPQPSPLTLQAPARYSGDASTGYAHHKSTDSRGQQKVAAAGMPAAGGLTRPSSVAWRPPEDDPKLAALKDAYPDHSWDTPVTLSYVPMPSMYSARVAITLLQQQGAKSATTTDADQERLYHEVRCIPVCILNTAYATCTPVICWNQYRHC